MFAIWMHFKGEYWKYVSKDLHLHTYFHNPPKKGVWIVDPWHVQQVEPQTLIMEKIIMEKNYYGKTGQSALAPWFYRKNQLWK